MTPAQSEVEGQDRAPSEFSDAEQASRDGTVQTDRSLQEQSDVEEADDADDAAASGATVTASSVRPRRHLTQNWPMTSKPQYSPHDRSTGASEQSGETFTGSDVTSRSATPEIIVDSIEKVNAPRYTPRNIDPQRLYVDEKSRYPARRTRSKPAMPLVSAEPAQDTPDASGQFSDSESDQGSASIEMSRSFTSNSDEQSNASR